MAAELINGGLFVWGGERDDEGHRTFSVSHRVRTTNLLDGPAIVMTTPGLPLPGAYWSFGNDVDAWAFCYPGMKVEQYKAKPGHPHRHWLVTQKFGTKPLKRCQDTAIEDPLMEPQKVSGSFVKYTREVVQDRFGAYIKSSSHEMVRGAQVEFDANRMQVNISQNVPSLELDVLASMMDTVNDAYLWGLPPRRVKLSEASWEKKYNGSCYVYFTRNFGFDIDFQGWDRVIIDEGTKALHGDMIGGEWVVKNYLDSSGDPTIVPDPNNPRHFDRITDERGNVIRMILNGQGRPISAGLTPRTDETTVNPGQIPVEYYGESNMLILGIPSDLEAP